MASWDSGITWGDAVSSGGSSSSPQQQSTQGTNMYNFTVSSGTGSSSPGIQGVKYASTSPLPAPGSPSTPTTDASKLWKGTDILNFPDWVRQKYNNPNLTERDIGSHTYDADHNEWIKLVTGGNPHPSSLSGSNTGVSTPTGPTGVTGDRTGFEYGSGVKDKEGLWNYIIDTLVPSGVTNSDWATGEQQGLYNQIQDLIGGDWTDRNNANNKLLDELNSKLNSGYSGLQGYADQTQDAYDNYNKLGSFEDSEGYGLVPEFQGNLTDALGGLNRDMDELYSAYRGVKNGTVPKETQKYIDEIYNNQMTLARNELNESYDRQSTNLLDNLGARGILNSSTSASANTGLAAELLKNIQNSELGYGTERANTMLETPYKIFDAATQLYNSSGDNYDRALAGYDTTYDNALNGYLANLNKVNSQYGSASDLLAGAQGNFNSLLNASNAQAGYGQNALTNISNLITQLQGTASLPSNVYNQTTGSMLDLVSGLLNAETARLTSGQASAGGGKDYSWIGPVAGAIGSIFS